MAEKGAKPIKITKKKILNAIPGTEGVLKRIAERIGCDRTVLWKKLKQWPELNEVIEQERETVKDTVELAIYKAIKAGNTAMIIYYAKTKMKDRGYSEIPYEIIKNVKEIKISFDWNGESKTK